MMISDIIERSPDLRFGQILQSLEVVKQVDTTNNDLGREIGSRPWHNEFYMEPTELRTRVTAAYRRIK